jgi:hypothetical protein
MPQACCSNRKLSGTGPLKPGNDAVKSMDEPWVTGTIPTANGPVPVVSTRLGWRDRLGSWKARWGIGRMDYTVHPGLYGVGHPDGGSPVLVTANYKMTFDRVRCELSGLDAWIMVLDTRGINVWCAAGKGTFGTREVVRRLKAVGLPAIVSHRTIILPQLGAPGVKAHEVTKATGFRVVYGPVRATDLPAFLSAGQVATPEMRRVRFGTWDRLVLTPIQLVFTLKPAAIALGILFILNSIGFGKYGPADLVALAGTILAGSVLTPVLLPVIPGKMFAVKGALLGLAWAAALNLLSGWPDPSVTVWLKALGMFLLIPAVTAFEAMNFTGCSTYTSVSGVNREMRLTLMPQLVAAVAGVILLLSSDLVRLF